MSEKIITCLNGEFVAAAEARVPVSDRGFRFGDGIFETIALTQGVPYQWEQHLTRMEAGLKALRIVSPQVNWQQIARELITKNNATEGFLRISISRGAGSRGYLPDPNTTPTWVIEYIPSAPLPEHPFKLWFSSLRRPSPAVLPTNYKLANGINNTLALMEAQDNGCDEALMLSHDQKLCEVASANLFWIKDNTLFTPSLETGCLAGVTRETILKLSPIPCQEVLTDISTLKSVEAIFISNARLGAWPVASIAPMGWSYATAHPILTAITAALTADRDTYIVDHRAAWATA